MLGLVGLLTLGLISGAYGVSQIFSTQAVKLADDRLQLSVVSAQQSELAKAKQEIKKYSDLAQVAKSAVPQDKDQTQTVRQIINIANANGINPDSVIFPDSTLGQKGKDKLSQLVPVKDVPGAYILKLTVQAAAPNTVPYAKFISFLAGLEGNRRTALVSKITLTPDATGANVSFILILDAYIKP